MPVQGINQAGSAISAPGTTSSSFPIDCRPDRLPICGHKIRAREPQERRLMPAQADFLIKLISWELTARP